MESDLKFFERLKREQEQKKEEDNRINEVIENITYIINPLQINTVNDNKKQKKKKLISMVFE
jgi:hypothetical protein